MSESLSSAGADSARADSAGASHDGVHKLIEEGQALVRSMAGDFHRRFQRQFDYDDLLAYGQVGLALAARDFDPERGVRFTTFAYYRIRGGIYEGLSKLNWTSRAHYNRLRADRAADAVLERGPHRSDGWEGTSLDEDSAWLTGVSQQLAVSTLGTLTSLGELEGTIEDEADNNPLTSIESQEAGSRLREFVERLDPEPRALIEAVYFEGTTLQEAANRIGVSKSWASRLHARTLQELAFSLREIGVESPK